MDLKTRKLDRRTLLTTSLAAVAGLVLFDRTVAKPATPVATPKPGASPAATPGTPVAGAVVNVTMHALQFDPSEITIPVGTTVVWKNNDVVAHTVTQRAKPEDQLFASPYISPGESFSFTFDKPGTYDYFCMPHPFMTGKVVVS